MWGFFTGIYGLNEVFLGSTLLHPASIPLLTLPSTTQSPFRPARGLPPFLSPTLHSDSHFIYHHLSSCLHLLLCCPHHHHLLNPYSHLIYHHLSPFPAPPSQIPAQARPPPRPLTNRTLQIQIYSTYRN
ncbi:hypothetical protein E2C01_099989 [Portunus trituberculatus]|uniref:Uncharacterized protein n=1 Tax=Portunus trituberculatus TaxID=210409 RepID=A0A5B7KAW8_PORTR|nr:hypothetical protein [Portunus trituberculatus]